MNSKFFIFLTTLYLACYLPVDSFTPTSLSSLSPHLRSPLSSKIKLNLSSDDVVNALFPLSLPPYLLFLREARIPISPSTPPSPISPPTSSPPPPSYVFPPAVEKSFRSLLTFVFLSIPSAIISMNVLGGGEIVRGAKAGVMAGAKGSEGWSEGWSEATARHRTAFLHN